MHVLDEDHTDTGYHTRTQAPKTTATMPKEPYVHV
jgi:hypothetical protein